MYMASRCISVAYTAEMNTENHHGIGGDITLCTLCSVSFGFVDFVVGEYFFIVAEIVWHIYFDVAVLVNLAQTLSKTTDEIRHTELCRASIELITIDEHACIVAYYSTICVGASIMWSWVGNDFVLETICQDEKFGVVFMILDVLLQPEVVLRFPIHPFIFLAANQKGSKESEYQKFIFHHIILYFFIPSSFFLFLLTYPQTRVEDGAILIYLKIEFGLVVLFGVGIDGAEFLLGLHLVALFDG